MRASRRVRVAPYALAVALFAAYAAVSISRHVALRTGGYDLGLFEQAVRGYAGLGAPYAELKGPHFNLLGDHFHPILATLAPAYRLWPTPVTLLVAQAALLAVSAVPVTRVAMERLRPRAGLAIGTAYGLSWGLQSAVGFDFHEICFAVPMLAFAGERLLREEWGPAVAWTLPLVLVKEDLPLTVAAVGGYLVLRGRRALGVAVVAFAVAAGLVIVAAIIPALNPTHTYGYSESLTGPGEGVPTKLRTLVWLLAPTAFLAVRSPLILLALPTLAWRFVGSSPAYWGTGFHYSAVLMPIVFLAFVDALASLRPGRVRTLAVAAAVTVALVLGAGLPLADLVRPATWRIDPAVAQVRSVLDLIPSGASVAASNRLAPQLTADQTVFLFPTYPRRGRLTEWVVTTEDDVSPLSAADIAARTAQLPALGYDLVVRDGPLALFRLGRQHTQAGNVTVGVCTGDGPNGLGDNIRCEFRGTTPAGRGGDG
jgi:uncharacterized membrane protein